MPLVHYNKSNTFNTMLNALGLTNKEEYDLRNNRRLQVAVILTIFILFASIVIAVVFMILLVYFLLIKD
jgi:uncharacterized membrane protein YagU involved in acid resistance